MLFVATAPPATETEPVGATESSQSKSSDQPPLKLVTSPNTLSTANRRHVPLGLVPSKIARLVAPVGAGAGGG